MRSPRQFLSPRLDQFERRIRYRRGAASVITAIVIVGLIAVLTVGGFVLYFMEQATIGLPGTPRPIRRERVKVFVTPADGGASSFQFESRRGRPIVHIKDDRIASLPRAEQLAVGRAMVGGANRLRKVPRALQRATAGLAAVLLAFLFAIAWMFVPALVSLPLAFPLAVLWHDPARILLLRPFGDGRAGRLLRRFVRTRVGIVGHTYTLADRYVRQRWWIRFPVLLGQLSFLQFRFRKIRSSKGALRLQSKVGRRLWRNLNWALSWTKVFPVASADAQWRDAIRTLLGVSDVVLVDVTGHRQGVAWEIQECVRLGIADRMVFFVENDERASAEAWLPGVLGSMGHKVHTLEGSAAMDQLERAVIALAHRAACLQPPPGPLWIRATLALAAGLVALTVPDLLVRLVLRGIG